MRRSIAVLAALLAVGIAPLAPRFAAAAPPPISGTIACDMTGELRFGPPYLPAELATPNTRPFNTKISSELSVCDSSGVVGTDLAVDHAQVRVSGKVAAETSCGDFLDTVSYDAKVKIRWLGYKNFGTSRTTVATVTWDDVTDEIVLVTNPISKGAFAGSTATMRFPIVNVDNFASSCLENDYRYTALFAGASWTLSVP